MNAFAGRAAVFYNVENLFDTVNNPNKDDDDFTRRGEKAWDQHRYQTKLDRIAEVLSLFHGLPAFIGLAEVENRTILEALLNEPNLSSIDYGIAHFESPDRRGIDCALCYDKAVFTPTKTKKLEVSLAEEPGFVTRDILQVEGELAGGVGLHLFVNHWSSRREGQRETEHRRIKAAEVLRQAIDQIFDVDRNANILVMGDFNDHPNNHSLEVVLGAKSAEQIEALLKSDSPLSGGSDIRRHLVNLLYDDHLEEHGTAVYKREWGVLDQIIVSQAIYNGSAGIGLIEQDAQILRIDKLLYTYRDGGQKPNATYGGRKYHGGYSDHLPVYIGLT